MLIRCPTWRVERLLRGDVRGDIRVSECATLFPQIAKETFQAQEIAGILSFHSRLNFSRENFTYEATEHGSKVILVVEAICPFKNSFAHPIFVAQASGLSTKNQSVKLSF